MTDSSTPPTGTEAPGFALWAVLRRPQRAEPARGGGPSLAESVAALPSSVTLRGIYDVSGLRADADLMIWLHGPAAEGLQAALRSVRASAELGALLPTWNALGVHRDAEFTRDHRPAFLRGTEPKSWLTVYPFVRSYEWYLLPDEERRALLAEHGGAGSAFRGVLTNTVASFSLGDYEWILALEADELVELVDLMRALRSTGARRHVREEVPFFTGRRIGLDEIGEVLA